MVTTRSYIGSTSVPFRERALFAEAYSARDRHPVPASASDLDAPEVGDREEALTAAGCARPAEVPFDVNLPTRSAAADILPSAGYPRQSDGPPAHQAPAVAASRQWRAVWPGSGRGAPSDSPAICRSGQRPPACPPPGRPAAATV